MTGPSPHQPGGYFKQTRGLYYSYLFTLPLFIMYELFIRLSQVGSEQLVRISVDVWLQSLFSVFGLDAFTATLGTALLIGAIVLYRQKGGLPTLKFRYFLFLLAESALYAILFSILISQVLDVLFLMDIQQNTSSLSKFQLFSLSLGAGLYEELFFRVILVSALFYPISYFLTHKNMSFILSAIVAAVAFSAVHYIGDYGDAWSLSSFMFRFLFGLALNLIYVIRGFGCAAWTHSLYNLIVIYRVGI